MIKLTNYEFKRVQTEYGKDIFVNPLDICALSRKSVDTVYGLDTIVQEWTVVHLRSTHTLWVRETPEEILCRK
jgi:hypothetical protein